MKLGSRLSVYKSLFIQIFLLTVYTDRTRDVVLVYTDRTRDVVSVLNGAVPVLNGAVPVLNGTVPVLNGTVPVLNGAVPVLNGAVPVLNGLFQTYLLASSTPIECLGNHVTSFAHNVQSDKVPKVAVVNRTLTSIFLCISMLFNSLI